jgi:hypothetical protein
MRRDVLGLRRPGLLPRPLDEAPTLRDLRQHEIEPLLQQLLVGDVGPRGPGLFELPREPLRDRDVQAARRRGERDDLNRSWIRSRARRRREFIWPTKRGTAAAPAFRACSGAAATARVDAARLADGGAAVMTVRTGGDGCGARAATTSIASRLESS